MGNIYRLHFLIFSSLISINLNFFISSAQANLVKARSANAFVNSIGVNVHLSRTQAPGPRQYTSPYYANWSITNGSNSLLKLLKDSGIQHIRGDIKGDVICNPSCNIISTNQEVAERYIQAYTFAGIKSTVLADVRKTLKIHAPLDPNGIPKVLKLFRDTKVSGQYFRNAIEAIEGPNEYDLNNEHCPTPVGATLPCSDPNVWAVPLQTYQKQLYETIRNDSVLSALKVIAPGGGGEPRIIDQQRIAPINDYFDNANHHPYPLFWIYPEQNDSRVGLSNYISQTDSAWFGKPKWITETGYHTAIKDSSGLKRGITELAQSKYQSRILAYNFSNNIARTYLYQFCDENINIAKNSQELNFGLIGLSDSIAPPAHRPWKLRPKPAYFSIKNLISLLQDSDSNFNEGLLDFDILNNSKEQVKSLLLQKKNGNFYLILWLGVPSQKTVIPPEDKTTVHNVMVKFNQPVKTVNYAVPRLGTRWFPMEIKNRSIYPNVPDELLILAITPG
jgi:hypothetical protein